MPSSYSRVKPSAELAQLVPCASLGASDRARGDGSGPIAPPTVPGVIAVGRGLGPPPLGALGLSVGRGSGAHGTRGSGQFAVGAAGDTARPIAPATSTTRPREITKYSRSRI